MISQLSLEKMWFRNNIAIGHTKQRTHHSMEDLENRQKERKKKYPVHGKEERIRCRFEPQIHAQLWIGQSGRSRFISNFKRPERRARRRSCRVAGDETANPRSKRPLSELILWIFFADLRSQGDQPMRFGAPVAYSLRLVVPDSTTIHWH